MWYNTFACNRMQSNECYQRTMSKQRRAVTMKDVARLAGVSQSTVSRVLNKATSAIPISLETRNRVLQVARELGYTPNPLARALRGRQTHLLGLIVREIADPFFAQLIAVISAAAKEKGYNLVLGHAQSSPAEALLLSTILDTRHCDGFIVLGDLRDDRAAFEELILKAGPRIISLCRGEPVGHVPTINVDNRRGVFLALEYLTGLGHRQIAFIDGGWLGDIQERLQAYRAFMEQHELTVPAEYIQTETNDASGGYHAMKALLTLLEPPTAILASDDVMAIGALKAASDMGYRVPADVSVIGFDDIEAATYTIPALTTVRQPIEEMGRKALSLLTDIVEGRLSADDVPVIRIEPKLVIRDSCAPPRGGRRE